MTPDMVDSALALGIYAGFMTTLAIIAFYLLHWGD